MTFTFSDELVWYGTGGASNRHRPRLCVVDEKGPCLFTGERIPGAIRPLASKHNKNGKWSYTVWTLETTPSTLVYTDRGGKVRVMLGHGQWSDPLVDNHTVLRWAEVPDHLHGVMRVMCPTTSKRLDENDGPI